LRGVDVCCARSRITPAGGESHLRVTKNSLRFRPYSKAFGEGAAARYNHTNRSVRVRAGPQVGRDVRDEHESARSGRPRSRPRTKRFRPARRRSHTRASRASRTARAARKGPDTWTLSSRQARRERAETASPRLPRRDLRQHQWARVQRLALHVRVSRRSPWPFSPSRKAERDLRHRVVKSSWRISDAFAIWSR
jgi:hypothetical protein